jgi:hypothetical protein
MSVINLTSYFSYLNSEKPTSVVLQDVSNQESSLHPKSALLALDGDRDVTEEISFIRQTIGSGNSICTVNIEVNINELERGQVNADNLQSNDFVNLRRISAELRNFIIFRWNAYLADEGVDNVGSKDEIRNMTFIGRRPDLLERLHQEAIFNHVTMFIFPVMSNGKIRQRAALFDMDKVISVTAKNNPEIVVSLPNRVAVI